MKEKEGCCEMVLPIRTKEEENKGAKKDEPRNYSGAARKTREKDFGWGTCLLRGKVSL